jgi:NAD(P)-dependent dehydrogenase (short-subunit alcohol dehydrogenase family)
MSPAAGPGALLQKVIVIVGGTTGIGLSAAQALIRAGAKVVAVGHPDDPLDATRRALGNTAHVIGADATHPETAASAIREALHLFGCCHGLYHVAGGSGRRWGDGPLHEIPDEAWRRTLDLNLSSVFYSNRAAARHFLEAGHGGAVLNLASVLALAPSPAHFTTHAYATAKAGILGLTRSCAATYAPNNIRFNALAPGLIQTPMAQRATRDPAVMAFIATKQPLDGGRIGYPSDLDAAAVFFMSDAAAFVTGQVLALDGGWSVTEGQLTGRS